MTQQEKSQLNKYLLSPKKFHLEMPLYFEISRDNIEIDKNIHELLRYSETIDAYCIWCKKESVFEIDKSYEYLYDSWNWLESIEFIKISCVCTRNKEHKYHIFFRKLKNVLLKIGQYPSVADFQIPQAEKYRNILGEEKYKELTRGIGLAAHGVGIGSFVYLRRIFEQLIENAHKQAIKKRFSEKQFIKSRMDEKIKLLEKYLPLFLVENRNLYSILSKGIHELDESECLKYFDTVRIGIEQILDEKIIQQEKERKAQEAKEAIQATSQEVNQPKINKRI
ncbi:hypothetical protein A2229_02315 [Candidatus Peregrinibacteria bacterium RIFOXYA2_FULL_33_7]|nr:MAG: hypothetical protein A2229_02315 [Candidatus Peregrinibacteria bacterium RIFOXYA2_FULL_33_7]